MSQFAGKTNRMCLSMPVDALHLVPPAEAPAEQASEIQNGPEQGLYKTPMLPGRTIEALGDGFSLAPDVDLDAPDPALMDDGRRSCIAATRAGTRCRATPARDLAVCNAHAGRLDSSAGGHALAAKRREARDEARNREIEARLGTRGVVVSALAAKHAEIRLAIGQLADRAAAGDRQCALALIPWLNQGLGMPAASTPVVVATPEGEMALDALDTASLQALLAHPSP